MIRPKIKAKIKIQPLKIDFKHFCLDMVAEYINIQLNSHKDWINSFLHSLIRDIIINSKDSDNFRNRLGGLPRYDLGIPKGKQDAFIYAIADQVGKNTKIKFSKIKRQGSNLKGKVSIRMVKSDYSDVLGLPEASVVTEKGVILPVLEWVLLKGDTIIKLPTGPENAGSIGFKVVYKRGTGRSTGATMEETSDASELFRISPTYSGTEDDNWLTRAITESIDSIGQEIARYFESTVF